MHWSALAIVDVKVKISENKSLDPKNFNEKNTKSDRSGVAEWLEPTPCNSRVPSADPAQAPLPYIQGIYLYIHRSKLSCFKFK